MPVKGLSLKVRVFITEYTNILKAVQCLHQHPWWGNRCWSSLLITSLWGLEAFIYFLLFLNHGIHSWVPHLRKYYHSNLELWAGMVMVFVIMTIKGHCATHLKVTGWHHLQHCKSGSLLHHFPPNFCIVQNLTFAALVLVAYVMLKQCNIYVQPKVWHE